MTGERQKKTINKCLCNANKKEEEEEETNNRGDSKKKKRDKVPQTHTSVWLLEEDLRARLPVLFEGTKYRKSSDTGKMCSFTKRCFLISRPD
jgi:hypothetical protein